MKYADINEKLRLLVTLEATNVGCSYYLRMQFDYKCTRIARKGNNAPRR